MGRRQARWARACKEQGFYSMWGEKLLEDSEGRGGFTGFIFSKTVGCCVEDGSPEGWGRGIRRALQLGGRCLVKVSKMMMGRETEGVTCGES